MKYCASIFLFVFITTTIASESDDQLVQRFDYDQKSPLGIVQGEVKDRHGVKLCDISYASLKGGRVPAYLIIPKTKEPFAAIVWGHWYMPGWPKRNRTEFLDEAVVLAHAGAVSILTDGPIARPGHVENNEPLNDQQFIDLVQQILDTRRAADLLLSRSDVDPQRLAYVGHSYNATVGGILSGIDKRFRAFVLMAGGLSDEVDSQTPQFQQWRLKNGPEKIDEVMTKYSWLDPGRYVSHAAPANVFLQYATKEDFLSPEIAQKYFTIVSEPKKLKMYDAPHSLNREATRDRIAFLTEQLSLKKISPKRIASIPELKQPTPEKKNEKP